MVGDGMFASVAGGIGGDCLSRPIVIVSRLDLIVAIFGVGRAFWLAAGTLCPVFRYFFDL